MKPREFWIYPLANPNGCQDLGRWPYDADDHCHTGSDIHVREINHQREESLNNLITALDFYFDPNKNSLPCYIDLKEAYEDFKKANE